MVLEDLNLTSLGIQMGGSAAIGAVIGFASKKIAKVIAVIVGLQLVLFKLLETRGFLQVNWGKFGGAAEEFMGGAGAQGMGFIESFVSTAGIGASFAGGFLLGFKKA